MDYSALYGRMKQMGISQKNLANKLGINANTLHLKLKGQSVFRVDEITIVCEVLNIPKEQIGNYFFSAES